MSAQVNKVGAEMRDTDVNFISIVRSPATRKRWAILKSEEGSNIMSKLKEAIVRFFDPNAPQVAQPTSAKEQVTLTAPNSTTVQSGTPVQGGTEPVAKADPDPIPVVIVPQPDEVPSYKEIMAEDEWWRHGDRLVGYLSSTISRILWRDGIDRGKAIDEACDEFKGAVKQILQITRSEDLEHVAKSFKLEVMRSGRSLSGANQEKFEGFGNEMMDLASRFHEFMSQFQTPENGAPVTKSDQEETEMSKEILEKIQKSLDAISDRLTTVEKSVQKEGDNPELVANGSAQQPAEKSAQRGDMGLGTQDAKETDDGKDAKKKAGSLTGGMDDGQPKVAKSAEELEAALKSAEEQIATLKSANADQAKQIETLKSEHAAEITKIEGVVKSTQDRLVAVESLSARLEQVERSAGMPKGGDGNGQPVERSSNSVFAGSSFFGF